MSDSSSAGDGHSEPPKTFVDGVDFYFDDDLMVLTRKYLIERGDCCGNGCRHCPFDTERSLE